MMSTRPHAWKHWKHSPLVCAWVVALALFTDMFIYGLLIPLLPVMVQELEGTGTAGGRSGRVINVTMSTMNATTPHTPPVEIKTWKVGLLFGLYALGLLLCTPLFGYWSDQTTVLSIDEGLLLNEDMGDDEGGTYRETESDTESDSDSERDRDTDGHGQRIDYSPHRIQHDPSQNKTRIHRIPNRRQPMLAGTLVLSLSTLLFALALGLPIPPTWQWPLLLVARLLQGASAGATWSVGLSLLADVYPPDRLGPVMGWVVCANTVGLLMGPPVGGWLYLLGGGGGDIHGGDMTGSGKASVMAMQLPFLVAAALALVDFGARWWIRPVPYRCLRVQKGKEDKGRRQEEELESDSPVASAIEVLDDPARLTLHNTALDTNDTDRHDMTLPPTYTTLLHRPELTLPCLATVLIASASSAMEPTLPLHLHTRFHMTPAQVGAVFMATVVPNLGVGVGVGYGLRSVWGRRGWVVAGMVGMAVMGPLMGVPDPHLASGHAESVGANRRVSTGQEEDDHAAVTSLVFILMGFGASMGMALTPLLPELADWVERTYQGAAFGRVYALFNMSFSVGMVLGPWLAGVLYDSVGLVGVMGVFSGLLVGYVVVLGWWFCHHRIHHGEEGEEVDEGGETETKGGEGYRLVALPQTKRRSLSRSRFLDESECTAV